RGSSYTLTLKRNKFRAPRSLRRTVISRHCSAKKFSAGRTILRKLFPKSDTFSRMKIRTLIVDDEPLARERLRNLLAEETDIDVIGECSDGREALAGIEKQSPDLVFLDVQMPEVDGFGVVAKLNNERVPAIIFVTAYD